MGLLNLLTICGVMQQACQGPERGAGAWRDGRDILRNGLWGADYCVHLCRDAAPPPVSVQ